MPLNLSFTHIMVVLIVALVVLGPDKLPEAARTAGRWIHEFRRMTVDLRTEVRESFPDFVEPFDDLRRAVAGIPTSGSAAVAAAGAAMLSGGDRSGTTPPNGAADSGPVGAVGAVPPLDGSQPAPGTFMARPPEEAAPLAHLPTLGPVTPPPGTFAPGPNGNGSDDGTPGSG